MANILDGKIVRDFLANKIKLELEKLGARPSLAIIQVGENPASETYIKQKKLFGEKIGFGVQHIKLDEKISEPDLIREIEKLNGDIKMNGIIVQLPIPKHIDTVKIINAIDPIKDVDGLNAKNIDGGFTPATTKGILSLLDFYKIPIEGRKVTVVGRSDLVGKPTAIAFKNRGAVVTVCHSKTLNIKDEVKGAGIVVVAVGKPKLIDESFVQPGQVIIDVGITRVGDAIYGDVDFGNVSKVVSAITMVPGGVGPMTVVSLFENILIAYKRQRGLK